MCQPVTIALSEISSSGFVRKRLRVGDAVFCLLQALDKFFPAGIQLFSGNSAMDSQHKY